MTRRLEQLNDLLRQEIAVLIRQELNWPAALITVSRVRCSPDLSRAKIYFTVLPEELEPAALKKLRGRSHLFSRQLYKKLGIKYIPRFIWLYDRTESQAAEIDKMIGLIHGEKKQSDG